MRCQRKGLLFFFLFFWISLGNVVLACASFIYNARKVTPKCESEAQIVNHQVKIQLTFQFLESQEEIESFEPLFKGRLE